jgi:hypothetical protein
MLFCIKTNIKTKWRSQIALRMEPVSMRKAEHARSLQYKYHTKTECGMSHNTVRQHQI